MTTCIYNYSLEHNDVLFIVTTGEGYMYSAGYRKHIESGKDMGVASIGCGFN